jgi:hypothetical protein
MSKKKKKKKKKKKNKKKPTTHLDLGPGPQGFRSAPFAGLAQVGADPAPQALVEGARVGMHVSGCGENFRIFDFYIFQD